MLEAFGLGKWGGWTLVDQDIGRWRDEREDGWEGCGCKREKEMIGVGLESEGELFWKCSWGEFGW